MHKNEVVFTLHYHCCNFENGFILINLIYGSTPIIYTQYPWRENFAMCGSEGCVVHGQTITNLYDCYTRATID